MYQQQSLTDTEVKPVDPRLMGQIFDAHEADPNTSQAVAVEVQKEIPQEDPPPQPHRLCYDEAVLVTEVQLGYNPLDYVGVLGQAAWDMYFPVAQLPAPYRKAIAEARQPETVEGEVVGEARETRPTPAVMAKKPLAIGKGPGVTVVPRQQIKE